MFDHTHDTNCDDLDIARYEVSEDGIVWRPYDAKYDSGQMLHKRIEFAPPCEQLPAH